MARPYRATAAQSPAVRTRSRRQLVDMPSVDDHRDAVELDRRRHDEAVEMDVARHQPAVLVGRIAERHVDRAKRLLSLRDLVADAGLGVEPDPDLADGVRVEDRIEDRSEPGGGWPAVDRDRAPGPDRDGDGRL